MFDARACNDLQLLFFSDADMTSVFFVYSARVLVRATFSFIRISMLLLHVSVVAHVACLDNDGAKAQQYE